MPPEVAAKWARDPLEEKQQQKLLSKRMLDPLIPPNPVRLPKEISIGGGGGGRRHTVWSTNAGRSRAALTKTGGGDGGGGVRLYLKNA